jgi:uncharacterized protein YprB with RNaseH-like and TPR domain
MQIDVQDYLPLVEATGQIVFFDIEATGLRGDYNSILVISLKPYGEKPYSFVVDQPGRDKGVIAEARDALHEYQTWVSYYGKGFDVPLLQARLLANRCKRLEKDKHYHLDMYFSLKSHVLTARRSLAHLLEWLDCDEKKMSMSPDEWNNVLRQPKKYLPRMTKRCESDVIGLENLYDETKHLLLDLRRG